MVKFKVPTKSTYFSSSSCSSLDMFKRIIGRVNFLAKLVGCDIYNPRFTVKNFIFFMTLQILLGFIALNFYSVYIYRKDLVRFCFCLLTLTAGFQGLIKLYTFLYYRSMIVGFVERFEKFLSNFDTDNCNAIFEKWFMIFCHVASCLFASFAFCVFMVYIYPIIYYIIVGEKILHFGYELPWVDWRTTHGYILNFIYVGTHLFVFIFATVACLLITIINLIMSLAHFDVLKYLLDELEELMIKNKKGENSKDIKKYIRLIAQMHLELIE